MSSSSSKKNRPAPPISTVIPVAKKRKLPRPPEVSEGTGSGVSTGQKGETTTSSSNDSSDDAAQKKLELEKEHAEATKKLEQIDKERRAAWERLLVSRPGSDQSEEMSAWLMRVMAVSDLKKTTKEIITQAQPGSSQQESSETSSISPGTTESSNEDSKSSNEETYDAMKQENTGDRNSNEGDSDW